MRDSRTSARRLPAGPGDDVEDLSRDEDDPGDFLALHQLGHAVELQAGGHRIRFVNFDRDPDAQPEVDRYKGELIATISHELKTPLTSIIGHTELLSDDDPDNPSVSAISRNAARLDRLITNLLNYSRMQNHRELNRGPLDLRDVVQGTVDMLRVQAEGHGVALDLDLPDEPVVVQGDPEELPRVVDNLCSNAVKYTPAGGQVKVTVRLVEGFAEVEVADTGLGISAADRAHLFSAFHRSTNPDALTIPGTGLGLAIARTIVEGHGGQILVDSELGEGSTFTLRIPAG